ncbi:MAG: hypothetical protein LLG06_15650 [Desulfobacteraceae bacterium]|nr:hypothetical protein [Desulfobacteraceae bacterium]
MSARSAKLVALAVLSFLVPPGFAGAADWALSPSVSISQRYDSNLFFSSDRPQSDFYSVLRPVILFTAEDDRTKLKIDSTVTGEKFYTHDELDNIFYDGHFSISRKFTERFSGELEGKFVHDATLQSVVEEAGLASRWTDRYFFDLGGSQSCSLTERLGLKLSQRASKTYYPSGVYPDASFVRFALGPEYFLTGRDTLSLNTSFHLTDYEDTSEVKEFASLFEWKRVLDETATLRLGAGCRYTSISAARSAVQLIQIRIGDSYLPFAPTDLVAQSFSYTTDDFGPVMAATLEKNWSERLSTSIFVGKDQYNSVNSQVYDRTSFGISAKYGLSEKTSLGVEAKYYHNESVGSVMETTDYVIFSPLVERRITENAQVRIAGAYELQHREFTGMGFSDRLYRTDRFMVWIELKYIWPRLFSRS